MTPTLFVANWKMNKSFSESIDFCIQHENALKSLSATLGIEIVICPSFPSLFSASEILINTMVHIGSQGCSPYKKGSYTGQVSAQSLKEVGCTYGIVGHSEQRIICGFPNEVVAEQAARLLEQDIHLIICIGETKQEYEQKKSRDILKAQLEPIFNSIGTSQSPITIAYEPVWSIGTGIIPNHDYLKEIYTWLSEQISQSTSWSSYRFLYGGSVDEKNVAIIKAATNVEGFLIGGASLDFQKFEKIVSLGK